jgi:hypothetical protein
MNIIDLAVLDSFQRLILTIETKKKFGVSEKWAAETRRNLVINGFYPLVSYFLLVTPEKFFLWTQNSNTLEETLPDYVDDSTQVLKPVFEELGFEIEQIDGQTFEDVISYWLKYSVIYSMNKKTLPEWLVKSELAEKIANGTLLLEPVV